MKTFEKIEKKLKFETSLSHVNLLGAPVAYLTLVNIMLAGREQFINGLGVREHHKGEATRDTSVGIDLDGDAFDLAEFAEVFVQLFVGGTTRQSANEELALVVLSGNTGCRLLLLLLLILILPLILLARVFLSILVDTWLIVPISLLALREIHG